MQGCRWIMARSARMAPWVNSTRKVPAGSSDTTGTAVHKTSTSGDKAVLHPKLFQLIIPPADSARTVEGSYFRVSASRCAVIRTSPHDAEQEHFSASGASKYRIVCILFDLVLRRTLMEGA